MTTPTALEIAVQDAAGARVAVAAGADRLELCQALGATGGITPSAGLLESVFAAVDPALVAVLVRPRPGGFIYGEDEVAVVASDIRDLVARGVGGVVIGALTRDGAVDADALGRWKDAAGDVEFVFHRAIDTLAEPTAVIDRLVQLGVHRILTSGGAPRSIDGAPVLADLVSAASGRLQIMAGGGVRPADVPTLVGCGVDAIHLSAKRIVDDGASAGPGGGADGREITDADIVAAARTALD